MVRLYIARSVTEKLQDNMQMLLVRINELAAPYGPMLLSLAGVSIDALETERDVDTDMESVRAAPRRVVVSLQCRTVTHSLARRSWPLGTSGRVNRFSPASTRSRSMRMAPWA